MQVLTEDQIFEAAPAAFSNAPAEHVSENYHFVNTREVLDRLMENGWKPIRAFQAKSRKSDPRYGKHRIDLVLNPENSQMPKLGELRTMATLINSHDWSSRIMITAGVWRLLCENGMKIMEYGQDLNVRHNQVEEDIDKILDRFGAISNEQIKTVERWSEIQLSEEDHTRFLTEASELRFGEQFTPDHTRALDRARRWGDSGRDLWHVFNRVQENGEKGTSKVGRMPRRVRALKSIDAMVDWNEGLRAIAEKFDPLRLN